MALIFDQTISKASQLPKLVRDFLLALNGRQQIALYGQLGAGKTTFTKAFCNKIGAVDLPSSPTFSLVNQYALDAKLWQNNKPKYIYHLDLYRLKNVEEAFDIGIEEIWDSDHYCLIEWPQVLGSHLPDQFVHLYIAVLEDGSRRFQVYDSPLD